MATSANSVGANRLIAGKYRLQRELDAGGMGSVWLAHHEVLDVDVAVKLISAPIARDPLAQARFEREAKAIARLKSPHIVRVHDYGIDEDLPFMVMELLEGEDLAARITRNAPLSLAGFAPLFAQICKGLAVVHEAGFVHRDLKPSNVFIAREGDDEFAKIVDFGLTKTVDLDDTLSPGAGQRDDLTKTGVAVGSPHHMSPEQAHGDPVDLRSDLWSLGVLVYRALTGKRPFQGASVPAVLISVVQQPIPKATEANPALPDDVDRFMFRALSRNVERRFQSAQIMSDALTAIADGDSLDSVLEQAERQAEGRADITQSGTFRATLPYSDPNAPALASREMTGSREVSAVTAAVDAPPMRSTRPLTLAVGVCAILGAGIFLMTRESPQPHPSPASSATAPGEAYHALPSSDTPPTPSTEATATASPSASPDVPRQASRPKRAAPKTPATATTPVRRAPAPPKPRIDPFTGLPIEP